jgi:hypothetical protein
VELRRDKLKATGKFSMPAPEKGFDLSCQVTYVNSDGKTIIGPLTTNALNVPSPTRQPGK